MIDFHNTLPPEPGKVTLTEHVHDRLREPRDSRVQYYSVGRDIGSIVFANSSELRGDRAYKLTFIGSEVAEQVENQDYRAHFGAGYLEAVGLVSKDAPLKEAMAEGAKL